VTSAEVIGILKKNGWIEKRTRGSHHQFVIPSGLGWSRFPIRKKTSSLGR